MSSPNLMQLSPRPSGLAASVGRCMAPLKNEPGKLAKSSITQPLICQTVWKSVTLLRYRSADAAELLNL